MNLAFFRSLRNCAVFLNEVICEMEKFTHTRTYTIVISFSPRLLKKTHTGKKKGKKPRDIGFKKRRKEGKKRQVLGRSFTFRRSQSARVLVSTDAALPVYFYGGPDFAAIAVISRQRLPTAHLFIVYREHPVLRGEIPCIKRKSATV